MLKRHLTLKEGIPLAFGSIMGSGILFLPALTYSIAGSSVLWAWLLATVLCFPLLLVFRDMFERVNSEAGISGYITLGLGKIGRAIPILFLATVVLGMPSAAIIAGNYLTAAFGLDAAWSLILAISIPALSAISISLNLRMGATVQTLVTAILVLMSVALIITTAGPAADTFRNQPLTFDLSGSLLAMIAAFWAFAGFENLSFIAAEFKNPKRDLFISCAVALVFCGLIYLGLTLSYSLLVPRADVEVRTALIQLSNHSRWPQTTRVVVGLFAYLSVFLNFNSWTWGISRMIYGEARKGALPARLGKLTQNQIPLTAVMVLALAFILVTIAATSFDVLFSKVLLLVSANFVVIYVLSILAFIKLNRKLHLRTAALVLLATLLPGLAQTGWSLIYPAMILLVFSFNRQPTGTQRVN